MVFGNTVCFVMKFPQIIVMNKAVNIVTDVVKLIGSDCLMRMLQ